MQQPQQPQLVDPAHTYALYVAEQKNIQAKYREAQKVFSYEQQVHYRSIGSQYSQTNNQRAIARWPERSGPSSTLSVV